MSYDYIAQRPWVFSEEGQVMFLKIRDRADYLLKEAGACRMEELIRPCTGDSWNMLACVDRLVELKELREITAPPIAGQWRVFVRGRAG